MDLSVGLKISLKEFTPEPHEDTFYFSDACLEGVSSKRIRIEGV